MNLPSEADVQSNFQVLDTDYLDEDFYGGAFEGSHTYGDVIILRLYSIIVDDEVSDQEILRVENRYHYLGDVIEHERTDYEIDDDRSVVDFDGSLEEFCRKHHYSEPVEEMRALVERVTESEGIA